MSEGEEEGGQRIRQFGHWGDTSDERTNSRADRLSSITPQSHAPREEGHKEQQSSAAPPQRRPPPPPTNLVRNRRMRKLDQLLKEGDFFSRENQFVVHRPTELGTLCHGQT